MRETIKLVLSWVIPVLCMINVGIYWGNTPVVLAWIVAATGWLSHLDSYYKTKKAN